MISLSFPCDFHWLFMIFLVISRSLGDNFGEVLGDSLGGSFGDVFGDTLGDPFSPSPGTIFPPWAAHTHINWPIHCKNDHEVTKWFFEKDIYIHMDLGNVMKAIWKRGFQRAVGNTKATLFSLKRSQEFLVTQPSCPSWWSSCQPWRASCHCPLCKWLWANEKAWNTLVGVQLEHFCQCGAVRLKSVSLWERCLLKTGPPATVLKNIFVWCRKCSQLSRICFFGASNKCEKG